MKILVTGGLGFIGSNFILNILKSHPDYKIINLDAMYFGSNPNNLSSLHHRKNYHFIKGDITDKKLVHNLINKVDTVVNFAAESHVDRSISEPKRFMRSNIMGVFNILEGIRLYKKKLIQVSTDEVFGSLAKKKADEKYRFNPSSPYASSKASAELLVNSYFVTYDCETIITRCTNNYGPRQFPEKLIPKTIILAYLNKEIPVYGTGQNIRDWIYVDDHCDAIVKIIENGKNGESYNISANNELSNITIIKKILNSMDKSTSLIKYVDDRPGHDFRYSLNSSKLRKLGWREKMTFKDGINKTIEWYLKNKRMYLHISKKILAAHKWN